MANSSRQLSPAGQKIFLAVLCLVFMSVGLSRWIPGFLLPVLKWSSHRKWKQTPCVITKPPLGGGGFRVEFRYQVDGETYDGALPGAGPWGPRWTPPPESPPSVAVKVNRI